MFHLLAEMTTEDRWLTFASLLITAVVGPWLANKLQAKELKAHSDKGRDDIKKEIVQKVEEKVNENTEVSTNAFRVANGFNEKLANLAEQFDTLNKTGTRASIASFELFNDRLGRMEEAQNRIELLLIEIAPEHIKRQVEKAAHGRRGKTDA